MNSLDVDEIPFCVADVFGGDGDFDAVVAEFQWRIVLFPALDWYSIDKN